MIKKVFESVFQAHVVKEQANVVKVKTWRLNCDFLVAILIKHDSTFKGAGLQCVPTWLSWLSTNKLHTGDHERSLPGKFIVTYTHIYIPT